MTVTTHTSAFVAGATGYTGRAVVAELRRRGIATVAHVRPDSAELARWQAVFEPDGAVVDTTPWDEHALTETVSRISPNVVFSLLGTTRARGRQSGGTDTYETVDYGLSAMLLRAVQRSAPRARFVYLSSIGVGPSARGDYLRVRWRFEQELRASGVPWTIARPAIITGPDRESRRTERILGAAIDGALRIAGALGARALRDRYSSVTGTELARGLVAVGLAGEGEGRVVGVRELSNGL